MYEAGEGARLTEAEESAEVEGRLRRTEGSWVTKANMVELQKSLKEAGSSM